MQPLHFLETISETVLVCFYAICIKTAFCIFMYFSYIFANLQIAFHETVINIYL